MRNKGQVFSIDISIGMTVFIVILIASIWVWDSARQKIYLMESRNDMEQLARNAASVLIQTPGNPPDWDNLTSSSFSTSSVYALGLVKNQPWFIDSNKTLRLAFLNASKYESIKTILGVKGPGYNLFINLSKYNQSTQSFSKFAYIGVRPNATAGNIVKITRIGVLREDKNWMRMELKLWKVCSSANCL